MSTTEADWTAMAYGYRHALAQAEEAHRQVTTNRPSAAKVGHAYAQGIVTGYEMALSDLKGRLVTSAENSAAQAALLALIEHRP
jgi:hypothetical protein